MNKKLKELLPAGLSETALSDIQKLVDTIVEERVSKETKSLSTKVMGFLKFKTNEIQEKALAQLEESNETYRNAKLFEHIRGLMAVEVASADYNLPLSNLVDENKQLSESVDSMSTELASVLEENQKLSNSIKLLEKKLSDLQTINEQKKAPFKSSEKAIVVKENQAKTKSELVFEEIEKTGNALLDTDILRLAGIK